MRPFLLCLLTVLAAAAADLAPAPLFGPGMVLQRDRPLPIWGSATAGARVTVTLADRRAEAVAGADGAWRAVLDPLPASATPAVLRLTCAEAVVEIGNVLVGDVWLLSGQSNMAFALRWSRRSAPATAVDLLLAAADLPRVRWFRIANTLRTPTVPTGWNTWVPQTAATAEECSLVGLHFARTLHANSGIPLGMVLAAQGGSPAETWAPRDAILALPHGQGALALWERIAAKTPGNPGFHPAGNVPGAMYSLMIEPLFPAAIAGVCWYQGESNVGSVASYPATMRVLMEAWRRGFGRDDLPFLVVQLPNLDRNPAVRDDPARWPWMREVQAKIVRDTPHARLVVSHDGVRTDDLHPWDKLRIGERLAMAARGQLDAVAPTLIAGEGAAMRVTFPAGSRLGGDPVRGFALAGADGIWHPAEGRIDGDTVLVTSPAVPTPAHLRYAWAATPDATLTHGDGLPVGCFRTDCEP